jgi:hypothetical protein
VQMDTTDFQPSISQGILIFVTGKIQVSPRPTHSH